MTARLPVVLLFLLLLAAPTHAAEKPAAVMLSEFIYNRAPFPSAHASTIVETPQGLVAAWFGGTREKHPDIGIWVSRHVDGKWLPPIEVANGIQSVGADGTVHRHPTWNPVLFRMKDGLLALFYKVGPTPQNWWGMLTTSDDDGATWSAPKNLPERMFGPIKNKAVQLTNGEVLCPSSSEDDGWNVHFERFTELDGPWTRTDPLNGPEEELIQPTVLFLGGENILALTRSQQQRIYEATSPDLGKTWSKFTPTNLVHPGSGIDAVTLADGRHLLVYNHTTTARTPLNLAISDDGKKWQAALALEDEPGEYSYPAIIQSKDGLVHITYTWKRKKVKHVVVDPQKLQGRDMVDGKWPADVPGPAAITSAPESRRGVRADSNAQAPRR
jgi:predicted neuraminidase